MKKIRHLLFAASLTLFAPLALASPLKVGISLVDLSNPFFTILAREISDEIERSYPGKAEILVQSSAYNLNKQIEQLNHFLQQDIDIIFVAASESDAIAPIIDNARAQGVVVVAVDIESSGADISVTSDNVQAGFIACKHLAEHLAGKGEVAIINGQPISSVTNRVTGCKNALTNYSEIKLVSTEHNSSGTFSGGLESMTYLMLQYPLLNGVFTINDPAALGALEALKQMGAGDIKITSVDGSPEFIEQLQQGQSNLLASAAQFPAIMARRSVALALHKLNDTSVTHNRELIKTQLVTKNNMHEFGDWTKQSQSPPGKE